jgi:hypothetical protein
LPEIRRFVKEPGHADQYVNLKVNFIPGKSPELICFNDDGEVDRVDLTQGQSTDKLHELVQERGLQKKLKDEL